MLMRGTWLSVVSLLPVGSHQAWLAASIVLILLLATLAAVLTARWQRRRTRRRVVLDLRNLGNVPSRFGLEAESPVPGLEFGFYLGHAPLSVERSAPRLAATGVSPRTNGDAQYSSPGANSPRQALDSAMATGQVVTNLLSTLAMIVPASMRGPLQQTAGKVRHAQIQANHAVRLPGQVTSIAQSAVNPSNRARLGSASTTPAVGETDGMVGVARYGQAVTPVIQPGDALVLGLLVTPDTALPRQEYPFLVRSTCLEQASAEGLVEQGVVCVGSPSWFRRAAPYILIGLATLATMGYVIWLSTTGVLGY